VLFVVAGATTNTMSLSCRHPACVDLHGGAGIETAPDAAGQPHAPAWRPGFADAAVAAEELGAIGPSRWRNVSCFFVHENTLVCELWLYVLRATVLR